MDDYKKLRIDAPVKSPPKTSYRRKPVSRTALKHWIPGQARNDEMEINRLFTAFKIDALAKSPHGVILRSGATKNLNDIRFFAIAHNDKRVFPLLFTGPSKLRIKN